MIRAGGAYVHLCFDEQGRVRDKGVAFGPLGEVIGDLVERSTLPRSSYSMGGLLLAAPSTHPGVLQRALCDALVLPLPGTYCRLLDTYEALQWCEPASEREEWAAFKRLRERDRERAETGSRGGDGLTGPPGRTKLTPG